MTNDDLLCQDLLGVLMTIAHAQLTWEKCFACGWLADPHQPCPTCMAIRRALASRREAA